MKWFSLVSDYRDGGLRMPHAESLVKTQRIKCLNKYHQDYRSTWKQFSNFYLHDVGGPFHLQCNYDKASFTKNVPNFNTERLTEWQIYQQKQVSVCSHVLDQIIWNNKFLKIGGKSLYRRMLLNNGIVRVKDILDTEGKLRKWNISPVKMCRQPAIWPPTTKYLPLASHLSDSRTPQISKFFGPCCLLL